MASIRKRGTKWQAQVRRKGRVPLARSFDRKADAVSWANRIELELEQRDLGKHRQILGGMRLVDLLERYLREIVP